MPAHETPVRLLPRHTIIIRLQAAGLTVDEISELTGLTGASIRYIQSSDIYQLEYNRYNSAVVKSVQVAQNRVREKISELVSYGMQELDEILRDKATPKTLRANIIFELLDRDGYKAPRERETTMDYLDAMTKAYERKLAEREKADRNQNS